jgi:polygalacturonase
MSAGVYDVLFQNLSSSGLTAGVRIKSQRGRGGLVANVTYDNIRLSQTSSQAVQLTMNYSPGLPPTNASATPALHNVTLSNILSESSGQGWTLDGLPEAPLQLLSFRNVSVLGVPAAKYIVACDNVQQASCVDVLPSCPPCASA